MVPAVLIFFNLREQKAKTGLFWVASHGGFWMLVFKWIKIQQKSKEMKQLKEDKKVQKSQSCSWNWSGEQWSELYSRLWNVPYLLSHWINLSVAICLFKCVARQQAVLWLQLASQPCWWPTAALSVYCCLIIQEADDQSKKTAKKRVTGENQA